MDPKTKEPDTRPPKRWIAADGGTVSCTEKVKVLEENWEEVKNLLQDVLRSEERRVGKECRL